MQIIQTERKNIIQMFLQKLSLEEQKKIDIGDINELEIGGKIYYTIKKFR